MPQLIETGLVLGAALGATVGGAWKGPEIIDWAAMHFGDGRERRLVIKELRGKIDRFLNDAIDAEGIFIDLETDTFDRFFTSALDLLTRASAYAPTNAEENPSLFPTIRDQKAGGDLRRLDFYPIKNGCFHVRLSDQTEPNNSWSEYTELRIPLPATSGILSASSYKDYFNPISHQVNGDWNNEGDARFFIQRKTLEALTIARDFIR